MDRLTLYVRVRGKGVFRWLRKPTRTESPESP